MTDSFDSSSSKTSEVDYMKSELDNAKHALAKEHKRYKEQKKIVNDLNLKIQLLEEENRLLQVTRAQTIYKPDEKSGQSIPTIKVTQILSDFDNLLETQSHEISKLMVDRDRLSAVCFKSLSLINTQGMFLNKLKAATTKFIKYACKNGETFDSVLRDFHSLGMDVTSELNYFHRANQVSSIIQSVGGQNNIINNQNASATDTSINIEQVEQILRNLPSTSMNDNSIQIISKYLMQQVQQHKENIQLLEQARLQKLEIEKNLQTIINRLKSGNSKKAGVQDALQAIDDLKKKSIEASRIQSQFKQLIETLASFGDRVENDSDIQRCLSRIRLWLQTPNVDISIIQEVDFLIGMLTTTGVNNNISPGSNKHGCDSIESVGPLVDELDKFRQCIFTPRKERDMASQVRELRIAVSEMRDKLERAERERRNYISKRFGKKLPPCSSWPVICDYIRNNCNNNNKL